MWRYEHKEGDAWCGNGNGWREKKRKGVFSVTELEK
jgi:hypothetical protein